MFLRFLRPWSNLFENYANCSFFRGIRGQCWSASHLVTPGLWPLDELNQQWHSALDPIRAVLG
jgi:hypothetical protein